MLHYTMKEIDQYLLVEHDNGKVLSFAKDSGVTLLEIDGYAFKDLNKNGVLDPYEDWRLPIEVRIQDLVKQMSIEDIAGLMLYSAHQSVSKKPNKFAAMFGGTYQGKSLAESGCEAWELSDQQKLFLEDDHVRHVLMTVVDDAYTAAKWNNRLQAYCESLGLGIPANTSSDPRHTPSANTEFDAGSGGDISKWPQSLGLAATFDPELVRRFGKIAAKEYRAMGISTALSPQVDLASEPRWMRFDGTFGEGVRLSCDMAEAYCDGFQTSGEAGWGSESVNAMVKHWPGGGSGEGGRDAHFAYGKFAIYPGNQFDEHLKPFTEGAFQLKNGTQKASAVMPYYTISYDQDKKNHENVGNSYSSYIISDLLRDTYAYDGVVCTDWMITGDNRAMDQFISGKCWGVERKSIAQRHYQALMAGVDQFGGNQELQPVLDAYQLGCEEHGEVWMRERMQQSATRLLRNMFQCDLFDHPYTDPEVARQLVGNPAFMKEGYEAQQKSIVLLKNHNQVLPIQKGKRVYVPRRRIKESVDWFGQVVPAREQAPIEDALLSKYYQPCEAPEESDFALVCIESPKSYGYGKDGYQPVTLQYKPYEANSARTDSIAQDPMDEIVNRSYKGKCNVPFNEEDLTIVLETIQAMKGKPVIVSLQASNPTVVKEFEDNIDGLLISFGVQMQAVLDCISGEYEPSGLLPFQMPADMESVECQQEDVARDMRCHVDADGNTYDFAYGRNYTSVIEDERVTTYF